MTTSDELRRVALDLFSTSGYLATSLQHIADAAGVSKASVLYHFASKEVLLEAVVKPALDELETLISKLEGLDEDADARRAFIGDFVDFLLAHRAAVFLVVGQQTALVDVPVIDRANAMVQRIAAHFEADAGSAEEKMRFGIALAGAAYLLAQGSQVRTGLPLEPGELRSLLVRILGELIAPTR